MTFKQYIKKQNYTTATIAKQTSIPYSTLNDIVNGKTDIDNVKFIYVRKIAGCLKISIEELFSLLKDNVPKLQEGDLLVVGKKYYIKYNNGEKECLCNVNRLNNKYIDVIAHRKIMQHQKKERFENWKHSII